MKIIRDIVWSSNEPLDKNVLWLNNGLIKYYGPNGWESLKYFSMLEDNIVGSIDAETHKIALSGSLPQDIYCLKYEDDKGIVLDNWAEWYLQKYQATENVYQNEQEGSYCVHVSGCASPIDSNGQPNTSGARVTKPLESEGAIVDVYEDYIDIRCMDLKNMLYLPIAQYRLTMKTI